MEWGEINHIYREGSGGAFLARGVTVFVEGALIAHQTWIFFFFSSRKKGVLQGALFKRMNNYYFTRETWGFEKTKSFSSIFRKPKERRDQENMPTGPGPVVHWGRSIPSHLPTYLNYLSIYLVHTYLTYLPTYLANSTYILRQALLT